MPEKSPQRPPSPVTVEDLLRLKSAEIPPPSYWPRFDTELRRRTWQTLLPQTTKKRIGQRFFKWSLAFGLPVLTLAGYLIIFQTASSTQTSLATAVAKTIAPPAAQVDSPSTLTALDPTESGSKTAPSGPLPTRFVVDIYSTASESPVAFKKVHLSETIHSDTKAGAQYVIDTLQSASLPIVADAARPLRVAFF